MRVFSAAETAAILPFDLLVDELSRASGQLASGKIRAPERMVVQISDSATHILMPCVAEDIGVTKLVNVHRLNYQRNLPGISGEVIVYSSDTVSNNYLATFVLFVLRGNVLLCLMALS